MISDIHTGNLLQGVKNKQLFAEIDEDEISGNLAPRKYIEDRTIYTSRFFCEAISRLYLCNLGEALIRNKNSGPAIPTQYRAPEVILRIKWGHAINQWSVDMTVYSNIQVVNLRS